MALDDTQPEFISATEASVGRITLIQSTVPDRLTKQFSLDENGELRSEAGGWLSEGTALVLPIGNIAEMAQAIQQLKTDQAFVYGVPAAAEAATMFDLVTDPRWRGAGKPQGMISRTNANFPFLPGPGVMMLDHDKPKDGSPAMTEEELLDAISRACPALSDATVVTSSSASSHIYNGETGEELKGAGGKRVYMMVADASDIPRAGKVLMKRLWLAGFGKYDVGAAGQLLDGSPVDGSVWQGSRLDFASGAECVAPLEQRRPAPKLWKGDVEIVDTNSAIPDLATDEEVEFARVQKEAKAAVQDEVASKKRVRADEIAEEIAGPDATQVEIREARRFAMQAMDGGVLHTSFPIYVQMDDGIQPVTVVDILEDPETYDGKVTLDPIEPEYDGTRPVGKLFLDGRSPNLYSFAHGGRNFRLQREVATLRVAAGETAQVANRSLDVLRETDVIFDMKAALTVVHNNHLKVPNAAYLEHIVAGQIAYERFDGRSRTWVRCDPPKKVIDQIMGMGEARKLQQLEGVSDMPLILPSGELVTEPGYDPVSKLYLFDSPALREVEVPTEPTLQQCRAALHALWWPFRLFPFVDDVSRGVMLAALLTAVDRQAMSTAPAFAMDAPVRGSGKTLLAQCLSYLAGDNGATMPPVFGNEEELRKRMTASVIQGSKVTIADNVKGIVRSVVLSQALTSGMYRDRILGVSEFVDVPYKVMEVLTSNNVSIAGDLARRIVVSRIDPEMETAYTRSFPFDPAAYVRENRMEMVAAALTLIRGAMLWKGRKSVGDLASFGDWNEIARKTVMFVDQVVSDDSFGGFADPVLSINEVFESDDEQDTHADLLRGLAAMFPGGRLFTAADVLERLPTTRHVVSVDPAVRLLVSALRDLDGPDKEWTSKGVGRALSFRKDTIVAGLCLRRVKKVDGVWKFKAAEVEEEGKGPKRVRRVARGRAGKTGTN